jgi:hypothetical protein
MTAFDGPCDRTIVPRSLLVRAGGDTWWTAPLLPGTLL